MKSILLKSTIILFSILFISCGTNKVKNKLIQGGTVAQEHYYTEIPFEKKMNLMVVAAEVNGVKGSFIVDTGAPNTITPEFASRLQLKTVTNGYINDSGDKNQEQNYVSLGEVKLGTVSYNNLGAVIIDMKSSTALACFHVDGIIGANLLRLSVFHIDNQNQKIILTDAISRLHIPSTASSFEFTSIRSGTPYVAMEIDGVKATSVTFDTGSNGSFAFNKAFSTQFLEKNTTAPKVALNGMATYGVFGKQDLGVIYTAKVKAIQIGDFKPDEKYIQLNRHNNLIGNKFLSHYNVTVDWTTKKITLEKIKAFDTIAINNFGFNATVRDGKVYVAGIYEGSSASADGLQSEDQILKIDNENFEQLSSDDICDLVMNSKLTFDYPNKQQLTLTVLRNGVKKKFTLDKKVLL